MRLISYNILDGATDRLPQILEVVQYEKPDVLGLVEADGPEVIAELARVLEMDFILATGNSHGSALLTRWTIRESINHALLRPGISKSCLEATVFDPAGTEWRIAVVHLHARATEADEVARERELAEVLDIFSEHRKSNRPHVLMGDFNANAPYQQIDPQRCKPSTREAWEKNGGGIPRRVVQRLLDAGYRDSLYEVDPVTATSAGSFTTEFPGQRVDYIFTFGVEHSHLHRAWINSSASAKMASDHFPIGLDIVRPT